MHFKLFPYESLDASSFLTKEEIRERLAYFIEDNPRSRPGLFTRQAEKKYRGFYDDHGFSIVRNTLGRKSHLPEIKEKFFIWKTSY